LKNYDESSLVIRLHQGEVSAFDVFYFRYYDAVYSNVFRLTRDAMVCQDILQEVFVTLWEKRMSLDPEQSVAGWLFVVSYNKAVTHLKNRLKLSRLSINVDVTLQSFSEPGVPVQERQAKLLEEAIEQLSPQKRKVFELCKLQGKTYEETAIELRISKHTVKEYLSAAVVYVKDYIRQHPEFESASISATFFAMLGLFTL
jgi:RNA polymerase sigma-70 factor (ECF subfamily)